MLDQQPTYGNYKDSGIPWLSEVPAEWDIQRAKWLFSKMERPVRSKDDVVTAFRDGQVTLRTNRRTEGFTNAIQEHGYQGIRKGDLVIHAMDAFAGAIGVSESDGKSSPVYAACVPRGLFDVSPRYYAYALRYVALSGYILSLAKGIRERSTDFRFKDFGEMEMPVPDLGTQNRIVSFLDEKTAEIDAAIAKKRRLIDLLNEQKAILINRAVTKGLNPNAPMKDSGVDWIGEIPAHWEVKRLKYATKIFRGKFTHRPRNDPRLYDGVYPFLQTGDVAQAGKFITTYKQTLNEKGLRVSTLVPKGTVVITIAANIGDISILGFDSCFPDSVVGFQPKPEVTRDFVFHALSSMKNQFMSSAIQNAQMNLNVERIGSNFVPMPPIQEQEDICAELDRISEASDEISTAAHREISTLNEFKQTLIANAVTGKIKI